MAYKPQVLTVPNGGTGVATLTSHGVLIGAAAGNITATAAGSSGQVLLSGGASADPSYSTATYPSTAGTSGNVLTSNGTNWSSSTPAYIATATGTLTNSQIKALHATPIQVVAAPGSGSVIVVLSCQAKMNYGGTNVFTAGAAQTINLYYGTSTSALVALTNANIIASATQFGNVGFVDFNGANSTVDNVVLNFYNPIATEITGNAANNNTVTYRVVYAVVSI